MVSIANQIAAQLLLEDRVEREAEERRMAAVLAAGPPAGSRITAEAWRSWHRYGFVACPGRKGGAVCEDTACAQGSRCAVMAAKGLHGDGQRLERAHRPLCGARTRAGGTCAMRVEPGKHRCRLHGGLSTGPSAEGRARLSERMKALWAAKKGSTT